MCAIGYSRSGSGPPLVLIHAAGMSRRAWDPVAPLLEGERDVIAIDLPGHGASPSLPDHLAAAAPAFARAIADLLNGLGIERAHVAGNSMGGWTALEMGKLGRAFSVVAFGPAGLWLRPPALPVVKLLSMHAAARAGRNAAPALMRNRRARRVLLGQVVGDPDRVPPDAAARFVTDLADASGFVATVVDTHLRRFHGGAETDAPVTIVYGQRERIVPPAARRGEELPVNTRWLTPPRLGHIPMWDDPAGVAQILLDVA